MTAELGEAVEAKIMQSIPLGRYGQPDEVAGLGTCLTTHENSRKVAVDHFLPLLHFHRWEKQQRVQM